MASKEELIEFVNHYVSNVTGDVKFSAKEGDPLPRELGMHGAISVILSGATAEEVFNALMVIHPSTKLDRDGKRKLVHMANVGIHTMIELIGQSLSGGEPDKFDPSMN